ncbi:LOW QUALITY PROTEIN: F-box/kelch-repeat-like protein [Cinnamomum micranthum f. kanehirae]|uniref:F-box/kelch-repeat-like protein n=1 Tax=Cinnamomum micranthum f. kanehirae TaxID=337451 RepID=A0A443N3Q1_9MAGN|nr:LOW QUALITY PROTEIN: F-box/kelch-repeat-like protein [Cinnamomum micranthum f. kanehirae]
MSFSSMPTSPDCVVFAILNHIPFDNILINTYSPGAQSRHSYIRWKGVSPLFSSSTNPIFYNGLFYCLGLQGNLGVYNVSENTWNVLKERKPLQLPI